MSPVAAARLAGDPSVASITPDRVVVIDAGKPGGSAEVVAGAQTVPPGIRRVGADVPGAQTVAVDVAVIDTGIASHADLTIGGGYNCQVGPKNAWGDGNGHGTHVAGTIAAKDDGAGVVGVAPGAKVWAIKVLNSSGQGSWSSIICGIDWVTKNKTTIEVANMSLGGAGTDNTCGVNADALHAAICRSISAGVTYAVAAGNEADDTKNHTPGAYDEPITVSALADSDGAPGGTWPTTACRPDQEDTLADFSNFGEDVDLIAPGVCVESTWLNGTYRTISGTSMATPHVAGAAALYKVKVPTATPLQVKTALTTSGTFDWTGDVDTSKEPLLRVPAP